MIEEPFRWVEAIANRREYIEHQLATGSPIAAVSYRDGILLLTLGRERQKIFEIYDRVAMGAIGHPGDIERLRMAAIEVASTEGFTRSACDVSLRRLANYALSPALKAAFEQIYGPPYLTRMIFAELGRGGEQNLFVRIDYDGSIHTNGGSLNRTFEDFGVISGTRASTQLMEKFLRGQSLTAMTRERALHTALDAWTIGHMTLGDDAREELPAPDAIAAHRKEQIAGAVVEAAVLERGAPSPIAFRPLARKELDSLGTGA
jgi:proteasome alpha subunit